MARIFEKLKESHIQFIQEQHIFFTATAPEDGRINLSPKGMDTFRVIHEQEVAYLDLTGSGNEAAAHLGYNSRMTMMFCSFGEKPLIFRLYGKGRIITPEDEAWEEYFKHFEAVPGMRHIVVLELESTQSSCGFAVPYYEFKGHREQLVESALKKGEEGLVQYRSEKNNTSLDGKPILKYHKSL